MDILLRSSLGKHTYSTQRVCTQEGADDVGGRVKETLVRTTELRGSFELDGHFIRYHQ